MKEDEMLSALVAERTRTLERELAGRKRMEDQLQRSLEFLGGLINRITDAMAVKDIQHRFVLVNDAACSLIGRPRAILLGKTDDDFYLKEQVDVAWKMDDQVLESGEASLNEANVRHASTGEMLTVVTHKTRYVDQSGNRFVVAVIRDITERKRSEESLRMSEERFRLSMEATCDGLWDWDIKTDKCYFSPSYFRMLGYEVGAFPEKRHAWNHLIHPDDREHTLMVNMDCVEGRREYFEVEYRMKAKNGDWRWILGRGKCVERDARGRALRLVGTHVDITGRKRVEEVAKHEQSVNQTIIESIPGTFYMIDVNGRYDRWNAYQRDVIVGKPDSQVATICALDTIHPDDRPLVREKIANVLKNGVNESLEARVLLRGGPAFQWMLMTGRQIILQGYPFLIGIGIDVAL